MSQIRRSNDRRRRVLYHSHVSPMSPSTPATRQATEQLRAARQPAQAFGSRVHRHLRGRWFSLVPVSRLAVSLVATVVILVPMLLALLHHLTFTWPSLAYQTEIARPLRIDFPNSFATWWTTMVLALSAGATRLIYVLRRHRRDDYRGHYQLWRLTLIVLLLASVHSTVNLVAWLGAFLDLMVGDRAVLSGANWLRIVLDVGGIVLAMRLIAEVHRDRPALIAMLASGALLGWSEAATWQLITVDSFAEATLVIAAPMLGWSSFLVAATIYLRSMYRQIRRIPNAPPLRQRLTEWMAERREGEDDFDSEFFEPDQAIRPAAADIKTSQPAAVTKPQPTKAVPRQDASTSEDEDEDAEPKSKKPGLFSRFRRRPKQAQEEREPAPPTKDSRGKSVDNNTDDDADDAAPQKPKRRWFGLRAAIQIDEEQDDIDAKESPEPDPPVQKKRRFSLRLKPQSQNVDDGDSKDSDSPQPATQSQTDGEPEVVKERKGWFGGLLRRKKVDDDADVDSDDDAPSTSRGGSRAGSNNSRPGGPLSSRNSAAQNQPAATRAPLSAAARSQTNASGPQDDEDDIDPDDIDWDSMSKAERRRMRKKLKRSGRAA